MSSYPRLETKLFQKHSTKGRNAEFWELRSTSLKVAKNEFLKRAFAPKLVFAVTSRDSCKASLADSAPEFTVVFLQTFHVQLSNVISARGSKIGRRKRRTTMSVGSLVLSEREHQGPLKILWLHTCKRPELDFFGLCLQWGIPEFLSPLLRATQKRDDSDIALFVFSRSFLLQATYDPRFPFFSKKEMDDKASVGKISVSSDSVSTLNSEDFVLISRQGDETPSTNNGSDDEKTGLKVGVLTQLPKDDKPSVVKLMIPLLGAPAAPEKKLGWCIASSSAGPISPFPLPRWSSQVALMLSPTPAPPPPLFRLLVGPAVDREWRSGRGFPPKAALCQSFWPCKTKNAFSAWRPANLASHPPALWHARNVIKRAGRQNTVGKAPPDSGLENFPKKGIYVGNEKKRLRTIFHAVASGLCFTSEGQCVCGGGWPRVGVATVDVVMLGPSLSSLQSQPIAPNNLGPHFTDLRRMKG
ncbi:Rab GTPase-activating protein 1, partial [Ophiophagus hannah]